MRSNIGFLIVAFFYGIQAVLALFIDFFPPFADYLTVLILLFIMWIMHRNLHFSVSVPLLLGIGFLPHIVGLFTLFPSPDNLDGTLYGAPFFAYQYDLFVHSVGFGILTLALCFMLYPYLKKSINHPFILFFVILFVALGFGAMNEVFEYGGYMVFGYGEGFLEFGTGDSTPDSGPWQDAMQDLIANFLGGLIAVGGFLLKKAGH